MDSKKIIIFLIGFFFGVIAAMAYFEHHMKENQNPLKQTMEEIENNAAE